MEKHGNSFVPHCKHWHVCGSFVMIPTADNHHWSSMYSTMITLAGLAARRCAEAHWEHGMSSTYITSCIWTDVYVCYHPISAGSLYIHTPQPRSGQAKAKLWVMALAWPRIWASQSHLRPSQSQGFQAKPGWNITTWDIWAYSHCIWKFSHLPSLSSWSNFCSKCQTWFTQWIQRWRGWH